MVEKEVSVVGCETEWGLSADGADIPMASWAKFSFSMNGVTKTTKPVKMPFGVARYMRYSLSKEGVTFLFSDRPDGAETSQFVEWEDAP